MNKYQCLQCDSSCKNCLDSNDDDFNNNLCTQCNTDYYYYQKENEPMNSGGYINCYKDPEGYYFYDHLVSQY